MSADKVYRLLLVEDNTLLREALDSLLTENHRFDVAGQAGDGLAALEAYRELQPDVVLMDLTLPSMSGAEAIRRIKTEDPAARILALTVHTTDDHIYAAFHAGADGYVPKDAGSTELFLAIESVSEGQVFISPRVAGKVIRGYLLGRQESGALPRLEELTGREREVLVLVADGKRNRDIGEILHISTKTVEKHRSNIIKKLDLGPKELAAAARKARLFLSEFA
ncbi:MAG: response regulator [Desulfovibrionaceae bacterium]